VGNTNIRKEEFIMTNKQTVTLTLSSMSFVVEGTNTEEMVAQAKLAMAQQLKDGVFPSLTYSLNDENALSLNTVSSGLIVESNDGKLGIVTAVNKKTIAVTYKNGVSVTGSPQMFKTSDATFEDARSVRPESYKTSELWFEGSGGYMKNKEEIHEIVVGKISRGKAKLHIVNTNRLFTVKEEDISFYLKDNRSDLIL